VQKNSSNFCFDPAAHAAPLHRDRTVVMNARDPRDVQHASAPSRASLSETITAPSS
jgi:hypothetical protein